MERLTPPHRWNEGRGRDLRCQPTREKRPRRRVMCERKPSCQIRPFSVAQKPWNAWRMIFLLQRNLRINPHFLAIRNHININSSVQILFESTTSKILRINEFDLATADRWRVDFVDFHDTKIPHSQKYSLPIQTNRQKEHQNPCIL